MIFFFKVMGDVIKIFKSRENSFKRCVVDSSFITEADRKSSGQYPRSSE